ncbi:MAG: hypothetical protein AB1690_07565 [Candidatus Zixiibacteriota bacterium]
MASRLAIIILFFLSFWSPDCSAQSSNFLSLEIGSFQKQRHEFKINRKRGNEYKLTINSSYRTKLAEKVSNKIYMTTVPEGPYGAISGLKAAHNRRPLKKDREIMVLDASRQDVFLTDSRIYTLLWPDGLTVGDTLSVSFSKIFEDVKNFPPIFIFNADSIAGVSLHFKYPKEISVDFEISFPQGAIPYRISDTVGGRVLEFSSLKRIEEKEYFPFNDLLAVILCRVTLGNEVLNLPTPELLSRWYQKMLDSLVRPESTLAGISIEGLDTANSNVDKLRLINDFVHKKIRYYSDLRNDHAIFPHAPSLVIENMYGDCKDRAYLAKVLAAGEGIKVDLALVSSRYRPETEMIYYGFFDHVVCYYEDSTSRLFFDPTAKNISFGYLPDFLYGKKALVLDHNNPRFLAIEFPPLLPSLELTIDLTEGFLDSSQASVTFRNSLGVSAISSLAELQPSNRDQFLSSLISERVVGIGLSEFQLVDSGGQVVKFQANADMTNYRGATPDKVILPQNGIIIADNKILRRENDSFPLYFGSPQYTAVTLKFGADEFLPPTDSFMIEVDNSCFYSSRATEDSSGVLSIDYQYRRFSSVLAGDRKQAFIDFCRGYFNNKANIYTLIRRRL